MDLTLEQANVIKRKFYEEHCQTLSEYIRGCGISLVETKATGPYPPEEAKNFCISVSLAKPLPTPDSLPEKYEEVRVYCQVVGTIRPASTQRPR